MKKLPTTTKGQNDRKSEPCPLNAREPANKPASARRLWVAVAIFCVSALPLIGMGIHHKWTEFQQEERVYHHYRKLVIALEDYEAKNGIPAPVLGQISPEYIDRIPSALPFQKISYKVIENGKAWELNILSSSHGIKEYTIRSNNTFSKDEQKDIDKQFHVNWTKWKTYTAFLGSEENAALTRTEPAQ